jgi:undecaprenyl diphosphate synthase
VNEGIVVAMDSHNLPKHVAIILDGNGRWARERNLSRSQGHLEGARRVEEVVYAASDMGIKALTLYTFSTENWKRPENEVTLIMKIVSHVLNEKVQRLNERNIRFGFVGRRDGAPAEVLASIDRTMEQTAKNTGLILNMAFNYGSRLEILDAVRQISSLVQQNKIEINDIDERLFSENLYTKNLPDPDLLIRTSGEKRISNFLLWQLSYAEFYFTDKFWPEFDTSEFKKAIDDYQRRERRYGEVPTQ